MAQPPSSPPDAQLVAEIHCRRCAYDLRGLSLDGRCPECGLEIWLSVQDAVDPAASKLPKLRDPIGVGNGLLWLVLSGFLATLLVVTHGTMEIAGFAPRTLWLRVFELPQDLLLIAGVLPLTALWSVYKLEPPGRRETDVAVRTNLRIVALSLIGVGAGGLVLWLHQRTVARAGLVPTSPDVIIVSSALHLAMALCAAGALRGVRGVLETIGRRSRAYRRARGGRQGVKPLMAACVGVALGNAMRIIGGTWQWHGWIEEFGTTIERVSAIMLVIGLAYLLVNAIWIRQALRKPPPKLDDLIRILPEG